MLGFALAGGGTKGAFEVGVITHLVGAAGLVPEVVAAASAGSIVGAKLAQARTPDEARARAAELRHDLLAMTDLDVVFGRQPWLADLHDTPIGQAIEGFLEMRPAPPGEPPAGAPPGGPSRAHHRRRNLHSLQQVLVALPALHRARHHAAESATSFLTLDPLEAALTGSGDDPATIAPLDPALLARPGCSLRLAITGLAEGVTRYVTEQGTVVEADATTPAAAHPDPVGVAEGVLTSSSAPMVFPPRRLGGIDYADGGIAQNLPVAAAVACGADAVIAVAATTLATPLADRDFTAANFLEIHLRSSQIMFSDHQRANLAAAPPGVEVTVVAPTVDLVGAFEVNEGLMRIDMDYGELRAAEALAALDDVERRRAMALTDAAVSARDRAWFAEEEVWHGRGDLGEVRRWKEAVAAALEARGEILPAPPAAAGWATDFEAHTGSRPDEVPERP